MLKLKIYLKLNKILFNLVVVNYQKYLINHHGY